MIPLGFSLKRKYKFYKYMITTIHGTGMELTQAIRNYAEEKITSLEKFFDNIQRVDIDMGMRSHHHQKGNIFYAEVNLSIPGHMLRVVKEESDLYKAVDKVKDHLKVDIEKIKDKMRQKDRTELRGVKEYQMGDE